MNLAVVGGGPTYTPEVVDGLTRVGDLVPVNGLFGQDPELGRLGVVGGMAGLSGGRGAPVVAP